MRKLVVVCFVTVFAAACWEDTSQSSVVLSSLPAFQGATAASPLPAGRMQQVQSRSAPREAPAQDVSDGLAAPDATRRRGESIESFVSRIVRRMQTCLQTSHLIQGTRFEACGARRSGYGYAVLHRPDGIVIDGADTMTVYVCHGPTNRLVFREGDLERDRTTHVAVRVGSPGGGRYWRHAHVRWSGDPCRPEPPPAPAARTYDSCTALRRDWNDGVVSDPYSWDPYPYPASWRSVERQTYLANVARHGEGGGDTYNHPLDSNDDGHFCDPGDDGLSTAPTPRVYESCELLRMDWRGGIVSDPSSRTSYPYPDSWEAAERNAYLLNVAEHGEGGGDGLRTSARFE